MRERNEKSAELTPRILSDIASRMFTDVSREFPASVPHQAARIALNCQKTTAYTPRQLGSTLLRDSRAIEKLATVATAYHKTAKHGPENPVITQAEVRQNVLEDYESAQKLMAVPSGELQNFLSTFVKGESEANLQKKYEFHRLARKYRRRATVKKVIEKFKIK